MMMIMLSRLMRGKYSRCLDVFYGTMFAHGMHVFVIVCFRSSYIYLVKEKQISRFEKFAINEIIRKIRKNSNKYNCN